MLVSPYNPYKCRFRHIEQKSAFLLFFYISRIRPQFSLSAERVRKASAMLQPLKGKGWDHIRGFNICQTMFSYFCVKE